MTKDELLKKLDSFLELKKDWDSYGADPVNPETILFAKTLIEHFPKEHDWDVVLTSSSGVHIEAHDHGKTILVEVFVLDE